MADSAQASFCILLAAPRSGTQLLGRAAEAAFGVRWLQEIFNDVYSDPAADLRNDYEVSKRASFFNFRHQELKSHPELSYPSWSNQRALFARYLESIRARFGEASFLMDVKYNSWHHLNEYWSYCADAPGLVTLVREHRIPVVHLVRENLFAQYCSIEIARSSGVWYSKQPLSRSVQLRVDVEDCRYWMGVLERSAAMFERWFDGHPVYRLTYETMIDGGAFSPHVERTFADALGGEPIAPFVTEYTKVVPPLSQVVANADEVRRYFRRSSYRRMVEQALATPATPA